jgi:hypothetical protein
MEPLRILGIPVTRPGYYYRNAMTLAQIELMAIDCSVTDYGTTKKKGKMTTTERLREMESNKADTESVNSAAEKWLEKYGNGQEVKVDFSAYGIQSSSKETYTLEDLKKVSKDQ